MYMMKDPKLILNLLFFFCLVACGDGTSVSPLLIEAEKYMNERPDSALLLLDSIAHPVIKVTAGTILYKKSTQSFIYAM